MFNITPLSASQAQQPQPAQQQQVTQQPLQQIQPLLQQPQQPQLSLQQILAQLPGALSLHDQTTQATLNDLDQRVHALAAQVNTFTAEVAPLRQSQAKMTAYIAIDLMEKGRRASQANQHAQAIEFYSRVIDNNPNKPVVAAALHRRIQSHYDLKNVAGVIADATRLIQILPATQINNKNIVGYLIHRAMAFASQANWDKTIEDCNQAIQMNPQLPWPYLTFAYLYLGMGYDAQGRVDEAISAYTRAIEINPKAGKYLVARARLNRGLLNEKNNNRAESLKDFQCIDFQNQLQALYPSEIPALEAKIAQAKLILSLQPDGVPIKSEPVEEVHSASLPDASPGKLLELCKTVRGNSRADMNCTYLTGAVLDYLTTGKWPEGPAKETDSTLADYEGIIKSAVARRAGGVKEAVAISASLDTMLFEELHPQSYDTLFPRDEEGVVDLTEAPTVVLDEKDLESSPLSDINERLKKEARVSGGVSVGLIGFAKAGAKFLYQPGHVLAYCARKEGSEIKLSYLDPQMIKGGAIDPAKPPVFEKLDDHYEFASQTASVKAGLFSETVFYLPLAITHSKKRSAEDVLAPTSSRRRNDASTSDTSSRAAVAQIPNNDYND